MEKKLVDLTVVIVNYNVCFFLEQCLSSVEASVGNFSKEVFVVDNNSVDDSIEMVKEKFPNIIRIENKVNVGFSKANNQAIEKSSGRYILLLNPDTVVEEDTLFKCFQFMEENTVAGGLGVRMLDGKGNFLPESKRGLPTPKVAFYKIFGLSKFFKKSKKFNYYHLGHLSEFETNEIDILSGAFMFMRSEALEKVGLLDENFFMYGEDIDLSYRLQLAGYKNFYFPETKIIHYKGESTKKSSVNYVFVFYRAMVIFAKKHFTQKNARLFSIAINSAIYLRAGAAIISRIIKKATLPTVDFIFTLIGLLVLTNQWKIRDIHFTEYVYLYQIPIYAFIWTVYAYFLGVYDKGTNRHLIWKSGIIGTLVILIVYALLPKELQFSRLFILTGVIWHIFQYYLVRVILNLYKNNTLGLPKPVKKRFAILSSKNEFDRIEKLLKSTYTNVESTLWLEINSVNSQQHKIEEVLKIYSINELIFSSKDLTKKDIIQMMSAINLSEVDFKIAQPEAEYLIGSNSIDSAGELYIHQVNLLLKPENRRSKRLFDVTAAVILFFLFPVLFVFQTKSTKLLKNIYHVMSGSKTWVGAPITLKNNFIKPGILMPYVFINSTTENDPQKINLVYANNFSVLFDLQIVLKNWKSLGK